MFGSNSGWKVLIRQANSFKKFGSAVRTVLLPTQLNFREQLVSGLYHKTSLVFMSTATTNISFSSFTTKKESTRNLLQLPRFFFSNRMLRS